MTTKRQFGSRLSRLLNGGATLSFAEYSLLEAAVAALPPRLRAIAEVQLAQYNLVQREVDGRALNFYRKHRGAVRTDGIPLLPLKGDAPLIRLSARIGGGSEPVHAVLSAVAGRVFSLTTDRALKSYERESAVSVDRVVDAWRSNLVPRAEV